MNEREFYASVRRRANLESTDDARAATTATLRTLGERLTMGDRTDVGTSLPEPLADAFAEYGGVPGDFEFDEFLSRVDERATLEGEEPLSLARAVGATFAEAVTEGELNDARAQLPPEYDRLFWMTDAEEFLAPVRRQTDLESTAARDATVAVLRTLGDRLSAELADRLAAYLPNEFGAALGEPGTDATDYDVSEFLDRVARAERADDADLELATRIEADDEIDIDAVRMHVRAVMTALADAIPPEEFDNARQQLPDTYGPLLAPVEAGGDGT